MTPTKANRVEPRPLDRHMYGVHHLIENVFAKIKQFRIIVMRYGKTVRNVLAATHLVARVIWLNRRRALVKGVIPCSALPSPAVSSPQSGDCRMGLHIDYYVSLNSPWTHMGGARIEALAMANDATMRVHPVDFGTVFAGSGGLPLPRRSPQRQAYRLMELRRWRDLLNIPIKIEPKHFPADESRTAPTVIAVRETIGDQPAIKLAHRILKAVWQNELNPGDPAVLAVLIQDVGLDPDAVMKLGADPKWSDMRNRETQAALDRGVFGAPSYVIGDEIFWGQDRLEFVQRRLARG